MLWSPGCWVRRRSILFLDSNAFAISLVMCQSGSLPASHFGTFLSAAELMQNNISFICYSNPLGLTIVCSYQDLNMEEKGLLPLLLLLLLLFQR